MKFTVFFLATLAFGQVQDPGNAGTNTLAAPAMRQKVADKKFKFVVSTFFAANALDFETTAWGLSHCSGCYEADPIVRPFVRAGRPGLYALEAGTDFLVFKGTYALKKEGKRWWWVPAIAVAGLHVLAGVHNIHVMRQ